MTRHAASCWTAGRSRCPTGVRRTSWPSPIERSSWARVHAASPKPGPLHRYDVDTGVLEPVDVAELAAARRGVSRALVVGPSAEAGGVLHTEGFLADTGSVSVGRVTNSGTNSVGRLTVNDGELDDLFDPHTGEPVKLRVPPGYESSQMWFLQWLDDKRFTLISVIPGRYGNWPGGSAPVGDLLVCRITEGRCDVRLGSDRPGRPHHPSCQAKV